MHLVLDSLLNNKSGIVFSEEYKKYNFKSQVCGEVKINLDDYITRKDKRFHLIFNVAIGGNWGGAMGIDDNIFPSRMEIDYVRVYSKNSSVET